MVVARVTATRWSFEGGDSIHKPRTSQEQPQAQCPISPSSTQSPRTRSLTRSLDLAQSAAKAWSNASREELISFWVCNVYS